jgi:hypothetical protein
MTDFCRRDAIRLLAVSMPLFIAAAPSWAQQRPAIAEQVAKAYGVDAFKTIEGIRWTFNVERPGLNLARSWEWSPKTGTISYSGKDKQGKPVTVTYQESQLGSQSEAIQKQIAPLFTNDVYWLLLPLHLVWDGSATVTDEGMHNLPIGSGSARLVVMKYPQAGYLPGDTWEFYVGADNLVEQIVYRRGVPNPPPHIVMAKFAGNKKAGPLLISTDHPLVADGKPAHLFLSGVAVKVTGSPDWIAAQ